jgi:mono/diheme cytochrome c family protein
MKNKRLSWQKTIRWSFDLMLGGLLLSSILGCNQQEDTLSRVERGERLYVAYCQMCHGTHGDGPMADLLNTPPPDLTRIAARRDGKFPDDVITQQISGKDRILGHTESDMPVFWVALKNGENLQDDHEVEERIQDLVRYLKSIQEKG